MPDDIVAPVAPVVAPTPAPAATPAAAEAAPAPAPVAVAAPTPAATPAEAAPTPTPAPAAPAVEAPTSILSEAKPAESVAPAPPATPVEVAPVTPPPPPSYESFKLPEGVQLDATKVSEFQTKLGQFEVENKADHAKMQAFGQEMVNLFVAEQQRQQTALVESFNQIRETWKTEIKNDPNFGGQNFAKTSSDAGALIEQYGGTADEVAALQQMLRITGAGDNPHLIRLLARAGKAIAKEGTPVAATNPKSPATVPRSQRRYGASLNGNGAS